MIALTSTLILTIYAVNKGHRVSSLICYLKQLNNCKNLESPLPKLVNWGNTIGLLEFLLV